MCDGQTDRQTDRQIDTKTDTRQQTDKNFLNGSGSRDTF